TQAVQFTLAVTKSGNGNGTVTSSPAGISCGNICSAGFNGGTSVTLTASPAGDSSTFFGWSGGGCSGTGTCMVTLSSHTTVTVTFKLRQPSISLLIRVRLHFRMA